MGVHLDGFRTWGSGFRVLGFGGLRFRALGLWGLGVSGSLGFRMQHFQGSGRSSESAVLAGSGLEAARSKRLPPKSLTQHPTKTDAKSDAS